MTEREEVAAPEANVAHGQAPRQPTGNAGFDAAALAGLVGNRAVARALAGTPRTRPPGRGLDPRSALLTTMPRGDATLSRKPVGARCSCGGTILPGGECSKCLARRLTSEGMTATHIQRVIADRTALARSAVTPATADPVTAQTKTVARPAARPHVARAVTTGAAQAERQRAETLAQAPCVVVPRLLARLASDSTLEGKVAPALAPYALGMDGRWLSRQLDAGAPLDAGIRREMEQTFAADFSGVRIHANSGARKVARNLNAEAVTVGSHVIFGEHGYSPNTREGRRLLRHELAHVVQQGGNREIPSGLIRIADPAERSEQEARAFAEGVGSVGRTLSRVSEPQLNRTSLCEITADAIAWGVNSALVAAIAAGCAVGTTFTIGGLAIPCTALVIGAAGVGAVNSVMWAAILKDAMCGIPITAHTPPQASADPAGVPSVDGTSVQPVDAMAA